MHARAHVGVCVCVCVCVRVHARALYLYYFGRCRRGASVKLLKWGLAYHRLTSKASKQLLPRAVMRGQAVTDTQYVTVLLSSDVAWPGCHRYPICHSTVIVWCCVAGLSQIPNMSQYCYRLMLRGRAVTDTQYVTVLLLSDVAWPGCQRYPICHSTVIV